MKPKPSKNFIESSTKKASSPSGHSLYIHIPFCAIKCRYCDFNSYANQNDLKPRYLAALLKELELRAPKNPATIFFGGGTPSILELNEISSIFAALRIVVGAAHAPPLQEIARSQSPEVTFECNPESLTLEKARLLRELGVNRISLGVQSFHPHILEFYDRIHDNKQAVKAYLAAREAGFDNINLDLIFGAPGQSVEEWRQDLTRAIELAPDHIAAYDLIFEEGTALWKWKNAGRALPQSEDFTSQMYALTMEQLSAAGYERYETSNYARDSKRCLHNINYWKNGSYVGVGAGAVSYIDGKRQKNPSRIESYIEAIDRGGGVFEEEENLESRDRLGETMMMRLRLTEGISREEVLAQTGFDFLDTYKTEISQLKKEGLIEIDSNWLKLSPRGIFLGDLVASRFL